MTDGRVDATFDREHHAAWMPEPTDRPWRPSPRARLAAVLIVLAGLAATAAVVLPNAAVR